MRSLARGAVLLWAVSTNVVRFVAATNRVAIRTAMSDAVAAAADSTVKYKSLAGAFDRTAGTAVYISSDTA